MVFTHIAEPGMEIGNPVPPVNLPAPTEGPAPGAGGGTDGGGMGGGGDTGNPGSQPPGMKHYEWDH